MAADFTGGSISGIWPVLHDDYYISDNRLPADGAVSVAYPPVSVLRALYPDTAGHAGSERDILLSAGG